MQRNQDAFYQPYVSDSEDSASITSSDLSDTDEPMTRQPIGSPKFLAQLGSINLNNPQKRVELRIQPQTTGRSRGVEYSAFDLSGTRDPSLPYTGTSFDMVNGTYTSILMINSRDRDTQVYPQPTLFTIRLPRTYRNIVSFQITQMKLLSSFYYFRPDKGNTTMKVLEQGRTITQNGEVVDNIITVTIRTGTYNINTLLSELQTQLNRTPLFFFYPNGFSDFITQFTAAGDLSVNFNQPGDNFFNSLTDTFIANPTMDTIVTTYFASRYAGLSTYSLAQVKVAYYYPVLYEMVLDPVYEKQLNLTLSPTGPQLLPGETVRSRILYTFQGLNDTVIQEVIDNNLAILTDSGVSILDNYRTLNTFIYSLVNEYNCTYDTSTNKISISTSRLNTSLYNLLNNQAALALLDVLNSLGLTLQQYSNLLLSNAKYTSVFTNMYNFMQSNFATYFAVNFGTYAPTFYTNVSNAPYLQNGIGAVGVATGYSLALLQSGLEPIVSSAQTLRSSPGYWPTITSTPSSDVSGNVIFVGSGLSTRVQDISADVLNVPYNTINASMLTGTKLIDNSGNIYINPTFGAGDCVTPVFQSQYTVFRFRSYVRQTLQVETLPLPYFYRFPTVNLLNFGSPIPTYFDASYSYINSPYLTRTDISSVSLTFPQSYSSVYATTKDFNLTVSRPVRYYTFTAPYPKSSVNPHPQLVDSSGYKYPLRVTVSANDVLGVPTTFPSILNIYYYHDQGAFYADVSGYRNENPYNYKLFTQTTTDVSSVSFTTNVFAGNQYYMIIRSSNVSFQNTRFKVIGHYPSGYSTPIGQYLFDQSIDPYGTPTLSFPVTTDVSYNQIYAIEYDQDFIRLPTGSNIMGKDPSSQSFNQFLPVSEVAIGYDISGVSSDLTDYRGYQSNVKGNVPFATLRVDPMNRYTFQSLSKYNTNTSNYFYTGSSNAILDPLSNTPYVRKTVPYRQYKIVNWYDQQYIPTQFGQRGIPNTNFVATSRVVDASYGSLTGYVYDASGNPGGAQTGMNLNYGVTGFGFLPQEGVWDIDQLVFKSAYMERPLLASNFTNPNKEIKYLGIYPTSLVESNVNVDISLNSAIVKLDASGSFAYTPDVQTLYNGFDTVGGTYFKFVKDSNFSSASRNRIIGYTPSTRYLFDTSAYYSVLAFDNSQNIIPFYTLMGSYIPYPTVSKPVDWTTISSNPPTPNALGYYTPSTLATYNSNYYPSDSNIYQSRYEQSMPIKTNFLHVNVDSDPVNFSNAFSYYTTNSNISTALGVGYAMTDTPPGGYMTAAAGQYSLWYNNTNLSSNFGNDARFYVLSNINSNYSLSNVSTRMLSLVYTNRFTALQYNPVPVAWGGVGSAVTGAYPIAMNFQSTASNLSNLYYLDQYYRINLGTPQFNWAMGCILSKLNFTTQELNAVKLTAGNPSVILLSQPYVNGVLNTLGRTQLFTSNAAYQNYNNSKLFVTSNGCTIFSFQNELDITNATPNPPYYFCVLDSNQSLVTLDATSNLSFFLNKDYYWTSPTVDPPVSYFSDWTCDKNGNLYVMNLLPSQYANFQKSIFNETTGNYTTDTSFSISYFGPNINTYNLYGATVFNSIAVDGNQTVYLWQGYQQGNITTQPTYLVNNWSIALAGKYAQLPTSSLLPGANFGKLFISEQSFTATNLDYKTFTPGFPLVGANFIPAFTYGAGKVPPQYYQMAQTQGFLFDNYTVGLDANPDVFTDLSGTYTFRWQPSGGGQVYDIQIPAQATVTQIQTTINTQVQTQSLGDPNPPTFAVNNYQTPSPSTRTYTLYVKKNSTVQNQSFNFYNKNTLASTGQQPTYTSNVSVAYTFDNNPPNFGYSATGADLLSKTINTRWQIFYPNIKIVLKKLQNGFTPITDTTDLTTYPSYSHTAMFYYDNYSDLSNDIFNKFGQESKSRFKAYDVSSGYEFKSYIYNIQLNRFTGNSLDVSNNNGYNFLAVRAYSPCENFKCLTRFYLPGRYDFGFIPLRDISNETQTVLVDLSGSPLVNPVYQTVLNAFNNAFKGSFTFGSNAIPGFPGSNYTFNGFGSFLNQYINNYNSGTSNAALIGQITSNVNSNVANYIQTYLSQILPSYVLTRERFTDPLLFSLLFKSGLSEERKDLEYEWGLGWNLGFPKIDTPYDTVQKADSFFKILDDYIYLKLNQEFMMNRMDSSGKEKLSITHDSTGQTNQFAAKLLLANFGSYAQTMVQNPIPFNPVLTSLDRLTFQWVDLANVQIDNLDCEWNAAIQIVEQVTTAALTSTIPKAKK
jgi:hypothetical protein